MRWPLSQIKVLRCESYVFWPPYQECSLYKHILIPTDGSDLSEQAVNYGVALAKAVSAKVTAITVSTPFHIFAIEPHMVADTIESYTASMSTVAANQGPSFVPGRDRHHAAWVGRADHV